MLNNKRLAEESSNLWTWLQTAATQGGFFNLLYIWTLTWTIRYEKSKAAEVGLDHWQLPPNGEPLIY